MKALAPLESLFDLQDGCELPLPLALATFYGRLGFPELKKRPFILGNFVTTLDGVVSLNEPGHAGGGDISGFSPHDRLVMGLLRAVVDAVIVGAGTLRSVPQHRWTAEYVYPSLSDDYQRLRSILGKKEAPLNVIVTARGMIDLTLPVFQSGEVPVLLVTTQQGAERIRTQHLPPGIEVAAVGNTGPLNARAILHEVNRIRKTERILVEGGPQLMGDFFAERALDELFLTLSPQIAGRDKEVERPGLVMGKRFAPDIPLWGKLKSVKRAESHLFLRYAFKAKEEDTPRDELT